MVFPLYDDNADRVRVPFVNLTLIALNVIVFLFFQQMGTNDAFTYAWSMVPEEIISGEDEVSPDRVEEHPITKEKITVPGLRETPISPYLTLLTSIFMHGSIMHLVGNMLFLWIFGDNVEDRLGHVRYLLFYLVCGLAASLAHVAVTVALGASRTVPCLGASGAISGVLGGYILLFPHRRVVVLLFRILTAVPAWVAIGIWFAFQLIASIGMFGGELEGGGVAYGAHIGGFIAGLALVKPFTIGLDLGGGTRAGYSYRGRR
jgi:membrane associated rhomboid family serine protease